MIILTAKDSDLDYATGINLGSDDYFTKPFSAISLVMRVKAILRRVKLDKQLQESDEKQENSLTFGQISINRKAMKITVNGALIDFSPTEYNLLLYLIENADRAVSREELLNEIWGYEKDIETRACDDTVRRIRKKLVHTNTKVETIWGFGFTMKVVDP